MIDLLLCWVVGPVGLLVASVGLSVLVERVADFTVPWTIRPALGLATAIALAEFGTATDATAELTVPAILVLAVAGLLLWVNPEERIDLRWAAVAALIVFGVYASPFLASGQATWAGFIKLDDTATWMALTDHVFEFGRGLGHLAPSTHEAVIQAYVGDSYPIGSLVPVQMMSTIVGQDVAWTIQPSMAVWAGVLALLIYELVRTVVRGSAAAAAIAAIGSLSSMLLGYYLWGGVKEMAAAALLALGPAIFGRATRAGWPLSAAALLAVASAALIGVLGPGGAVWLAPTLAPAILLAYRALGAPRTRGTALIMLGVTLVLVLPVIFTPVGVFNPVQSSLTEGSELGNLNGPLNLLHVAGLWPAMDFRSDPHLKPAVLVLAVVCLLLAAGAVIACWREPEGRGLPFAAYAGGGAVGAALIMVVGSPWVDGKAMTTISPALLAAAMLAIVLVWQRTDLRIEAAVAGTVVGGIALWSAFLAYHGVWLAPRAHYTELERIGDRFKGDGPALSTEVAVYGARHFLRKEDDEGATDLRRRQVLLTGGRQSQDDQYVDLDDIEYSQLAPYNLIVVRRGPQASRPPGDFALAYAGKYYEVWRRVPNALGTPSEHLGLGDLARAGGTPDCAQVQRLAARVGPSGQLVAARTTDPIVVNMTQASRPPSWSLISDDEVNPSGSGKLTAPIDVPAAGPYEVWLGGAVFGRAEVSVDGHRVGDEREVVNASGQDPLGTIDLSSGRHSITLDYQAGGLAPGAGADSYVLGPLTLDNPNRGDLGIVTVPASRYRDLCGESWDWIESYPAGP